MRALWVRARGRVWALRTLGGPLGPKRGFLVREVSVFEPARGGAGAVIGGLEALGREAVCFPFRGGGPGVGWRCSALWVSSKGRWCARLMPGVGGVGRGRGVWG